MGSIEGNSTLTACQCSLKLQAVDAERLREVWPSERGLIYLMTIMLNGVIEQKLWFKMINAYLSTL